jgi:PEGA domain
MDHRMLPLRRPLAPFRQHPAMVLTSRHRLLLASRRKRFQALLRPALRRQVPSEPFARQPPHEFGTVAIMSDPDGAEIYVDEKFVGNAPAKLKLAAGSHIMVIKAAGFAKWKRTLEILKYSQVTLKPVLDYLP